MKQNGRFPQTHYLFLLLLIFLLATLTMNEVVTLAQPAQNSIPTADTQMYIILLEGHTLVEKMSSVSASEKSLSSLSAQIAQRTLQAQQALAIKEMTQVVKRPLFIPHQYTAAINGMAVELTEAEADELAQQPNIRAVVPSMAREPLTDSSPDWLGATSLWNGSQTGGIPGTQGEGIIIGIIDTGINMDHPSFATVGGDGYVHTNPNGAGNYLGKCATQPDITICNDKLIGAYSWPAVGDNPEDDWWGHGSNVAGIAAGNIMTVTYPAPTIVLTPTFAGIAPHANIIAYDVCQPGVNCPDELSIAAIEQAILDGVDVLNFSIGGTPSNPWVDPLSLAFLSAREAGIFVATSAGNSGPSASSILSPGNSPWMTSVGNVTGNGRFDNVLTPISGGSNSLSPIPGISVTGEHGPAPIVSAAWYTNTNGVLDNGTCQASFPAGTWMNGEIVFCRYSGTARLDKAAFVQAGGAGGIVIDNGLDLVPAYGIERFPLPGLNIGITDATALNDWLSSGSDHMAEIRGTIRQHDASYADELYYNSSRGPAPFVPDILKPNVSAPGVMIWAAGYSTDTSIPPEFSFWRGTSQASPHVAGSAALLKVLHPDWTPAEIESALMMTAVSTITSHNGTPIDAFDRGSGRIDLTAVSRIGFVLDETVNNFRAANPVFGQDLSQLNLASLTDANCATTCTWTRQLRSTLDEPTSWDVDITQPITAVLSVEPTHFTLQPGATQFITVTAVADSLPLDTWDFGTVHLSENTHKAVDAHLPVTLKRVESNLIENIEIHTRQDAGSHLQSNLFAPDITELTVTSVEMVKGTFTQTQIAETEAVTLTLSVPANTKQLAAEIVSATASDVQLYSQKSGDPRGTACKEQADGWAKRCYIVEPDAGEYEIVLWNTSGSELPMDDVELVTAVVPNNPATNNWVTGPIGQAVTEPFDLRYFWQEPALEPGERWYGGIELGTEPATPNDLGFIPVTLVRHGDGVSKTITPTAVTLASQLTTTITIQPNVTPLDLGYVLTETIPAGLTVTSVTAPPGTVTQTDESLRWEGVLPLLGMETAVIQYQATVGVEACNQILTSNLTYLVQNPGSQPISNSMLVTVDCGQVFLPTVIK